MWLIMSKVLELSDKQRRITLPPLQNPETKRFKRVAYFDESIKMLFARHTLIIWGWCM